MNIFLCMLKLLKNYLKPSISQEMLNDLVILYVEKDMIENIDINTIINNFPSKFFCRDYFVYVFEY
jgi:hypothetical protein